MNDRDLLAPSKYTPPFQDYKEPPRAPRRDELEAATKHPTATATAVAPRTGGQLGAVEQYLMQTPAWISRTELAAALSITPDAASKALDGLYRRHADITRRSMLGMTRVYSHACHELPPAMSYPPPVIAPKETRPQQDAIAQESTALREIIEKHAGVKHDAGKPRWDLLPVDAINGTLDVLAFGAEKYADRNWERGINYSRVYAAAMRHLTAWFSGEDMDAESGRSHLDHAACCVMFLQAYTKRGMVQQDDRPYDFVR